MKKGISYYCYRVIRWLIWLFYPRMQMQGLENLPQEPCIIAANHAQMHGPIACELYIPGDRAIWCAGEMMHLKTVPDYAFADFWSRKPKYIRWFYCILSYVIAPISVCIFNHAHTIGVYRDRKIIHTFRDTQSALQQGRNVVIFPEHDVPRNHIVHDFQEGFVDVARRYHKVTGKDLSFVPMYIAPKLKTMYLGKPVRFCSENSIEEERKRICAYLMEQITQIAVNLPEHTVVPYPNISKKLYPNNKQTEGILQ